ncbi:MAG: hypothetical protein ACFFDW_07955 [Candidatus Thorarchaeota archaeon]
MIKLLSWINYLSVVIGVMNFLSLIIITSIVLKRNVKEKLNWLFASSFFFLAIAYVFLPIGAFVYTQENPAAMLILTEIYGFCLSLGIILLMLSSIAFNYGTRFIFKWFILLPAITLAAFIGILLFVMNAIKAVQGSETPDIQTTMLFTAIYYPICAVLAVIIYIFLGRAYKHTQDTNIRKCLKFFIVGLSVSLTMLIPNILSNILADIWDQAQILNGMEYILVTIGITLMLVGFLIRPVGEQRTEEVYQVAVS